MDFSRLRRHISRPDFHKFQKEFEAAAAGLDGNALTSLRLLGAEAMEVLIESSPMLDKDLLIWFCRQYDAGNIEPTERLLVVLPSFSASWSRPPSAIDSRVLTGRRPSFK